VPLFKSRSGLQVFENPGTLPRARVLRRLLQVPNREAIGSFIADPANDLTTTAVMLSQPPPVESCPASVHEVYGVLRGVVVDGGEHTIEMTYRPWTALAGGIMTLAGLASGLLLWLIARR
jgi:hypothetical protein